MTAATDKLYEMLARVREGAFVKYGLSGVLTRAFPTSSLSFFSADDERHFTLAWEADPKGKNVHWAIFYRNTEDTDSLVELDHGDILSADPTKRFVRYLATLVPEFPRKTLHPKGRFFATIFGWTLALATLSLFRLIGSSLPPSVWSGESEFPDPSAVVSTVQQLARTLSLGDLPMLVAGSFVNSPVAGLLIIASIAFSFVLYTMPQIGTSRDLVSDRALVVYLAALVPTAFAAMIAPWPVKIGIIVLAAWCLMSQLIVGTIPWQLERWLVFSRRTSVSAAAQSPVGHAWRSLEYETLGQGADLLLERATLIRRKIWKKRDKGLTSDVQRMYTDTRQLRIDLAFDARAAHRGRRAPSAWVTFIKIVDTIPFQLRGLLIRLLPAGTVLAVVALMLGPTPWIAPSCITHDGEASTVYLLTNSDQPTYLKDTERVVVQASSWEGFTLTSGSCGG